MKPITPQECIEQKELHPTMFKVVNELLTKNYNKGFAKLLQKEIVEAFLVLAPSYTETRIFDENLLDIESFYEKAGWKVVYDKPAYNESYEPTFEFTPKHSSSIIWKDR